MLYRLQPPATLTWCDVPSHSIDLAREHPDADLDRLPWAPTEARVFSTGLLRIALRHGTTTKSGIVLSAIHTANLGRADELRLAQLDIDEAQAELRRSSGGQLLDRMLPGWAESGAQLDDRVRESTEHAVTEAETDLAEVLGAPARPEIVEHWIQLGGQDPGEAQLT